MRQLADGQGYIIQRYDYSPFGRAAAEGGWANPLQYTGEQWDADAGLLYLRARWYDPSTGRFLSRDPFPGLAALPQTQNPYVYVGNNPANLTDPGGDIAPIIAIPLIVGGVAVIVDWGIQVYQNVCTRDMSFWDAVYYRNLDWNEMATVGVTAAGATVMVLGGTQMVLAGGSLLLWQVGIWAQSPTAIQWGNAVNAWAAQYEAWLWSSQTAAHVSTGTTRPVRPYDIGTAEDLLARSVPGDRLQVHHVPQAHPASQVMPGYDPSTAPEIALPDYEHYAIPNLRGVYGGTTRDLVARDLWNLRMYTGAPNSALQQLLNLIRQMYDL
ncbi:MAG: RHS repeat-associated core domain-containing protein [Anaerolineae bacterium]